MCSLDYSTRKARQLGPWEVIQGSSFAAMKRLLFLGLCLVALASQTVMAQTSGPDIIVVRVEETNTHVSLTVERVGQAPEGIGFDYDRRPGKAIRTSKGYLDALSKFYEQGYVVQAVIPGVTYTTAAGVIYSTSTLIFTKPNTK